MTQAFGEMLPFALVVALSPIPIVAVIAMLFSQRAIGNGVAFLLGWIVGVAGGLALLTLVTSGIESTGDTSTVATTIRFALGLLCLAAAIRKWRGRPRPGADVPMPRWMERVDGLDPGGAAVLAVLLGGLNPKNLLMNFAAATVLSSASLPRADDAIAIALYTAVASASVAIAVLYRLIRGERAAASLGVMREWLVTNNATVMSVLFLVFGVKLVGDAIAGL